ncbi:MAG TPA: sulfur carrier protein ThiS, partial [Bacteroidales bacterium]|nr:sulfur carrier protein ThiS [Bacteroidales bacterium]
FLCYFCSLPGTSDQTMTITLNNNPEELAGDLLRVSELLQKKNFTFKMLIVKINGTLVNKQDYETATVKDGDRVEVLHLISGG